MSPSPINKKVVFISFVSKPAYFEERFFVEELTRHGLEIEFWDLSCIFGGKNEGVDEVLDNGIVRKISISGDVSVRIKKYQSATFVLLFNLEYRFLWLYRLLTAYRCRLCFFAWGAFPGLKEERKPFRISAIPTPGRLCRWAALRFCKQMHLVKDFDVVMYAGTKSKETQPNARQYIPVNLPDFEEYCDRSSAVDTRCCDAILDAEYVVFLDAYLPFHPDFRINNLENINQEKYRIGINNFFDKIESETGKHVVIAAHPKAEYPHGYFGTRSLIKNKTAQLVMLSHAVISHYSTATSYAILWKKPLIFIYSDDMKRATDVAYMMSITTAMANELDMSIINIDHLPQSIQLNEVRDEVYDDYRMKYITTSTSCESRNKDIFIRAFAGN